SPPNHWFLVREAGASAARQTHGNQSSRGRGLPVRRRRSSIAPSASRDRPDHLDLAVAHAHVPVMDVAGRVAMAGNELQLFVDTQNTAPVLDDAVLVRAVDVSHIVAAMDDGQAAIDRLRLEARIADRQV